MTRQLNLNLNVIGNYLGQTTRNMKEVVWKVGFYQTDFAADTITGCQDYKALYLLCT